MKIILTLLIAAILATGCGPTVQETVEKEKKCLIAGFWCSE